MLVIKNLSVSVEEKQVLDTVSVDFEIGKNYCLLGKNGSGKSTLAMTVMGHPAYEAKMLKGEETKIIETTKINKEGVFLVNESDYIDDVLKWLLEEKWVGDLNAIDILALDPEMRSKLGIFVAFQNIPEIKWVKLFEFLRTIYNAKWGTTETFISFKKIIEPLVAELAIDRDFLWRDVNVGFSGGERRKIEILQLKLLKPRYVFLDEVDSGLDVDAFKSVANLLREYDSWDNSFIIVTHYFSILDYIPVDIVYLMEWWKIIWSGGLELAMKVKENGFGS